MGVYLAQIAIEAQLYSASIVTKGRVSLMESIRGRMDVQILFAGNVGKSH